MHLSSHLDQPLLWLLCLHHILELVYGDASKVYFPTEGPKESLYTRFEKFWMTLSVEDFEDIKSSALSKRQEVAAKNSFMDFLGTRTSTFLSSFFVQKNVSGRKGFQRDDYFELAWLTQVHQWVIVD